MGKLPALMLYPGDWLQDEIAGCSIAAQGLMLRIMFLGHSSTRYGYLVNSDGSPIPHDALARRCACTLEQFDALLTELDSVGKLSRTPEGIIYLRRMVRDEQKRSSAAERQARFRTKQVNTPKKALHNAESNDTVTPSVTRMSQGISSSISSSIKTSLSDEELLPEMAAQAVMDRCRISGMGLSVVLTRQAKLASDAGEDLKELTDRMVKAWDEFLAAKPKLKWFPGAEKFFGEGYWNKPETWPWKDNQAPDAKPKRRYVGEVQ